MDASTAAFHSYPVSIIPYKKNSSLYIHLKNTLLYILKIFSWVSTVNGDESNSINSTYMEIDKNTNLNKIFSWLSKNISINSNIIILDNNTNNNYDKIIKKLFKLHIPTRNCYYLHKIKSNHITESYHLYYGKMMDWPYKFNIRKFDEINNIQIDDAKSYNIYKIIDYSDIEKLFNISNRINFNGVLNNSCRFIKTVCPALKLDKIYIDKKCNIKTCINGDVIGSLDDEFEDIVNKINILFQEKISIRECNKCSIELWCPKCIFSFPMKDKEYCKFQQKNHHIQGIISQSLLSSNYE